MSHVVHGVRLIVEQYPDGYVAYPLGVAGVVVGQGDTRDEAIADALSALRFHIETFGPGVYDPPEPIETVLTQASL